jgi:hypothetical protein
MLSNTGHLAIYSVPKTMTMSAEEVWQRAAEDFQARGRRGIQGCSRPAEQDAYTLALHKRTATASCGPQAIQANGTFSPDMSPLEIWEALSNDFTAKLREVRSSRRCERG